MPDSPASCRRPALDAEAWDYFGLPVGLLLRWLVLFFGRLRLRLRRLAAGSRCLGGLGAGSCWQELEGCGCLRPRTGIAGRIHDGPAARHVAFDHGVVRQFDARLIFLRVLLLNLGEAISDESQWKVLRAGLERRMVGCDCRRILARAFQIQR